MRHTPYTRYERFEWTPRKLSAAANRPLRQAQQLRQSMPLLAAVLPQPAPFDAHQERINRQAHITSFEGTMRALHARVWKESRSDYFAATDAQREAIRTGWRQWRGPTTSLYFRYMVDLHIGVMQARSESYAVAQQAVRSARQRQRACQLALV